MTVPNEVDAALCAAAMREVDALDELRKLTLEQHSHSYKWITASLLAINGGAAVTILGNDYLPPYWKIITGSWFSVGIVLSLLVAVVSQKVNIRALLPIQRQIGYWIGVAFDGERLEEVEATLQNEFKEAAKFAWIVPALGWLSALAFVAGLLTTAFALLDQHVDPTGVLSSSLKRDCDR